MRSRSNQPIRQNKPPQPQQSVPPAPPRETPVTRYIHPIQANPLYQEGPLLAADPLATILDTLARHTEMLEELLRRTGNNNPDTM